MVNTEKMPPAEEISFDNDPIKKDILDCARHALVMEFRSTQGHDPSPDELITWAKPFLDIPDQVKPIVERRNRSIIMFAGKYPDFWEALARMVRAA